MVGTCRDGWEGRDGPDGPDGRDGWDMLGRSFGAPPCNWMVQWIGSMDRKILDALSHEIQELSVNSSFNQSKKPIH